VVLSLRLVSLSSTTSTRASEELSKGCVAGRVSSGCFFRAGSAARPARSLAYLSSHQLDELLGMSPKPVPPYLRMVEVSAWLKD